MIHEMRFVMGVSFEQRVIKTFSKIYGIAYPLFLPLPWGTEADGIYGSLSSPNSPRVWESSWPQWTIFPVRKQNKVTENKISGIVSSTKYHAGAGGCVPELCGMVSPVPHTGRHLRSQCPGSSAHTGRHWSCSPLHSHRSQTRSPPGFGDSDLRVYPFSS